MPQGQARVPAEREQRVERRAGRGPRRLGGKALEQAELEGRGKIEDLLANRDAAAGAAARRSKHPERQVLDREIGVGVGGADPAPSLRGMGMVDHARLPPRSTVNRAYSMN